MMRKPQHERVSQRAMIVSIAPKLGCTPQALCNWARQAEHDERLREGLTTSERERMKAPEREARRADEILRKSIGVFCLVGARPPIEVMTRFMDEHRESQGVGPTCKALPIAA